MILTMKSAIDKLPDDTQLLKEIIVEGLSEIAVLAVVIIVFSLLVFVNACGFAALCEAYPFTKHLVAVGRE